MLSSLSQSALQLPRFAKRGLVLFVDISLCVLTLWFAFYLRIGELVDLTGPAAFAAMTAIAVAIPVFIAFGLYQAIFRYAGWPALMTVTQACLIYGVLYAALFTVYGFPGVPRTIGLIQPILLLLAVGASRAVARFWLGGLLQSSQRSKALPATLIYGAGDAGMQLANAMANNLELRLVGFLDDDTALHGRVLHGLKIYSPTALPELKRTLQVTTVLLALPSVSRRRRNEILQQIRAHKVLVRTLPSYIELAQGRVSTADVRELDIDDLLGREPVAPNRALMDQLIHNKTVLVTGAGGSIGSELCRQILHSTPAKLLLLEQSEFALYRIQQELEPLLTPSTQLIALLASVQDQARMRLIFDTYRPNTVYHAAAYKHVPLVEHNPSVGISNNVLGTRVIAECAQAFGVADCVLISTDKAVRPTNIMGASKRLAELILQALAAERTTTRFSMVRFGNVLDSSGSVVPKFRQQIRDGGPVTLTHLEITRYFMTIPEAAQLVIQAGAMAQGGEVFVLDMGQPVRIQDLARRMIELSGLTTRDAANPDGDIEIVVTGLRPGEKLFEELLIGQNPQPTAHPRIMKAQEDFLPWSVLDNQLHALNSALDANQVDSVRQLLATLVSGYVPNAEIVDWVHLQQVVDGNAQMR